MATLNVLIAKSGIMMSQYLPPSDILAVARCDRDGPPQWWTPPPPGRYDRILIADHNVATAMTQRRVALDLPRLGVHGPIWFAGTARGRIGFLHQDFVPDPENGILVPRPPSPPSGLIDRYLIALVGLPAAGKTFVRRILGSLSAEPLAGVFSTWKWSSAFMAEMESRLGRVPPERLLEAATRFFEEVESKDRLAVARRFLANPSVHADPAPFLVVESIKNWESLVFVSYTLQRPFIVVAIHKEEKERLAEAARRGDPDDANDAARLRLLERMGTPRLIQAADFVVDTTGCFLVYDSSHRQCHVHLTPTFLQGLSQVLAWILFRGEDELRELIIQAICRLAQDRGFEPVVEVSS